MVFVDDEYIGNCESCTNFMIVLCLALFALHLHALCHRYGDVAMCLLDMHYICVLFMSLFC